MSTDKFKDLIVYFNGEYVPWDQANVHVFSPAVKYGASVFEGIRGYWNADKEKTLFIPATRSYGAYRIIATDNAFR